MKILLKDIAAIVVALATFGIGWFVVGLLMSILFNIPIPRINDPGSDSFINQLKIWVLAPGISAFIAIVVGSHVAISLSKLLYGFLTPIIFVAVLGILSFVGVLESSQLTIMGGMGYLVLALQISAIICGAYLGKESAAR